MTDSIEVDEDSLLKKQALDAFLEGSVLTETGERIVAHAAVGRGNTFAVFSGAGHFDLRSGTELGRRAQKAYFKSEFQRDMVALAQKTQKLLKEQDSAGVSFVASSPFKSKRINSRTQFPRAYIGTFTRSKNGLKTLHHHSYRIAKRNWKDRCPQRH